MPPDSTTSLYSALDLEIAYVSIQEQGVSEELNYKVEISCVPS